MRQMNSSAARSAREPKGGVVVAQPAHALLQVRLQEIERLTERFVALRLLGELRGDERVAVLLQVRAHLAVELGEQRGIADEEARVEVRRERREVLTAD